MRSPVLLVGLAALTMLVACSSASNPPAGPSDSGTTADSSGSHGDDDSGSTPSQDASAGEDASIACGTLPTAGVYATFTVGSDTFHVAITNRTGIDAAIALWKGTAKANIPTGDLLCQQASWNCPWHWQLDPATVDFAEVTTEVCDGRPSDIESGCKSFGGGRYCPWSAQLTELRDCRTDATCPAIAK